MRHLAPLLIALAPILAAPVAAQDSPFRCEIVRECEGETCRDTRGTTLWFEPTETGLIAWDAAVPAERIVLTRIPGEGLSAWSGRAPDIGAVALVSMPAPDQMVITLQGRNGRPVFHAIGECGPERPAAPLSKRG